MNHGSANIVLSDWHNNIIVFFLLTIFFHNFVVVYSIKPSALFVCKIQSEQVSSSWSTECCRCVKMYGRTYTLPRWRWWIFPQTWWKSEVEVCTTKRNCSRPKSVTKGNWFWQGSDSCHRWWDGSCASPPEDRLHCYIWKSYGQHHRLAGNTNASS